MQSYENGSSTVCKEDNWGQLATFFFKKELEWPGEVVEATLKGLPDAAHQLMEFLYSVFTQRPLPQIPDTAPRKEPSVTVPIGQPIASPARPASKTPTPAKAAANNQGSFGSNPIQQKLAKPQLVAFSDAKVTKVANPSLARKNI